MLQVYGRRAQWEDPADWVLDSFPWGAPSDGEQTLVRVRQEDVGYDTVSSGTDNNSPKVPGKQINAHDGETDSMISDV